MTNIINLYDEVAVDWQETLHEFVGISLPTNVSEKTHYRLVVDIGGKSHIFKCKFRRLKQSQALINNDLFNETASDVGDALRIYSKVLWEFCDVATRGIDYDALLFDNAPIPHRAYCGCPEDLQFIHDCAFAILACNYSKLGKSRKMTLRFHQPGMKAVQSVMRLDIAANEMAMYPSSSKSKILKLAKISGIFLSEFS